MKATISTFTPKGIVDIPTSKSGNHRYLIMAFLSNKEVTINDVTFSNDIEATLNCLISLGARVKVDGNSVTFFKPNKIVDDVVLDANESGSTLRFLLPLAASLTSHFIFKGKKSLFSRPLSIYEDIFKKQNIKYIKGEDYIEVFSKLKLQDYEIPGNISSQFITGLIFASLLTNSKNKIKVIPPFESKEYVDITLATALEFGFKIEEKDLTYTYSGFNVVNKNSFSVEKDFSQAAFFLSLGSLKGEIELDNLNLSSHQGDKQIIDILKRMGADIKTLDYKVIAKASTLKGTEIDLASCIDLGPILFVTCALANGKSHIKNIRRLRIKESDRVNCMVEELSKAGVKMKVEENDIYFEGKNSYSGNYDFDSHNDHRIAMALSVFAAINNGTCTINNAECINKSYVKFYDDLKLVGGNIDVK